MSNTSRIIVVAGTASGVGKTSLTLGIARALSRRGLRVQTFKVGPDYLDPTHLSLASGRPCYNLDGWMTSLDYLRSLVSRLSLGADICVVEGVMGLYDGAEPDGLAGSTAEVAIALGAPVLLVCNAHGMARSLAAVVKGYAEFVPEVQVAGVLGNRVGSSRHVEWLNAALCEAQLAPLVGAVPRGAFPELKSRHLGLVSADPVSMPDQIFETLGDVVEKNVDLDRLIEMAGGTLPQADLADTHTPPSKTRIGVAQDRAFHFYYPDNLDMLRAAGAQLVPFSPLHDQALPADLGGIILGGGYPEEFGQELAANGSMRRAIKQFVDCGRPVYAECGGLMYLGSELVDRSNQSHAMCGVFPFRTRMLPKRKALGYMDVSLIQSCCLGPAGLRVRGHEFHYSEIDPEGCPPARAFLRRKRRDPLTMPRGFLSHNVIASYMHLHFASAPQIPANLVQACLNARGLEAGNADQNGRASL